MLKGVALVGTRRQLVSHFSYYKGYEKNPPVCWYDEIAALPDLILHLCRLRPLLFGDWRAKIINR
jgi:hypothetical protein